MSKLKGQNLRVKIGTTYLAYGTTCSVHASASVEDSTTKDSSPDSTVTDGKLWQENEVTQLSWDFSSSRLVALNDTNLFDLIGDEVDISFDYTSGPQNQTTGQTVCSGKAIINDISVNAPNAANVEYTIQGTGTGALLFGGSSPSESSF